MPGLHRLQRLQLVLICLQLHLVHQPGRLQQQVFRWGLLPDLLQLLSRRLPERLGLRHIQHYRLL